MGAPELSAKLEALGSTSELLGADCLSDEEVLAFASGTLASARHLEAHYHLDQCEVCQHLLSEAAHALGTAVSDPFIESKELTWHTTFQPGTLVGRRYLIVHFIARGGMGEVYEAFDRDLQERVALKTVASTACDNESAVRRLKAEVQLARRVSHPNVCRIYDFGTHIMADTGAQISFLTMEFVDGETLGQHIRSSGALAVNEARAVGRQLLSGLSAAHEAGVLHRDFKSDNVMLRDEPGAGRSPLILDFGLARALDEGSRNNSSSHPNLLGTFGYIAPEQLQGRPHTTASDVYSFGIVWFQMLTGELPFECPSSPVSAALARIQASAVAPSSKNPNVPHDLDAVVLGCLRRSPKDRFRTAGEVLLALDAAEARAQRSFQKRTLLPLTIAAALGAVAAYGAAVSLHRPVAHLPPKPDLPPQAEPTRGQAESVRSAPVREPGAPPAGSAKRAPRAAAAQPSRTIPLEERVDESVSDAATDAHAPGSPPAPQLEGKSALGPSWEDPFDAGPARAQVADGGP